MKSMPPSYCLWCEEKLASKVDWPYCSAFCKKQGGRKR